MSNGFLYVMCGDVYFLPFFLPNLSEPESAASCASAFQQECIQLQDVGVTDSSEETVQVSASLCVLICLASLGWLVPLTL